MTRSDEWTAGWVRDKLLEQKRKEVRSVDLLSRNLIQVNRAMDSVLVATLAVSPVRVADVQWALGQQAGIRFVANISSAAKLSGDAIKYAKNQGAALGGFGDLGHALKLPNPGTYVDKETSFREQGLRQHDRVKAFHRLDDNRYTIERHGHPPVTVVFLYDYDLSADAVRTATSEYGPFQAVIKMNPNGNISTHAYQAAQHKGIRVLKWGELLGELNRKWT